MPSPDYGIDRKFIVEFHSGQTEEVIATHPAKARVKITKAIRMARPDLDMKEAAKMIKSCRVAKGEKLKPGPAPGTDVRARKLYNPNSVNRPTW